MNSQNPNPPKTAALDKATPEAEPATQAANGPGPGAPIQGPGFGGTTLTGPGPQPVERPRRAPMGKAAVVAKLTEARAAENAALRAVPNPREDEALADPEAEAPAERPARPPRPAEGRVTPMPQAKPPKAPPAPSGLPIQAPAGEARLRRRHGGLIALAFLMVFLPGVLAAVYLWKYAVDQYVSVAGFAIRTETPSSPFEILGAFGGGTSTSSKDMDILDNFIASQQLVEALDKQLDLRAIYSKPQNDPYFAFDTSGTIEDLVDYWSRMVVVDYDNTTGLMELSVHAFTPEDAQAVAKAVLDASSQMINQLAAVARNDTTQYAKESLDQAEQRLQEARTALTQFRVQNNIVDPSLDLGARSQIVISLTQNLVQAQVELQVLKDGGAPDSDPRVVSAQRRVGIIQSKINDEEAKVAAANGNDAKGYAELVAAYERLKIDQEFAEKAYLTALATYDAAVAEASHKQVYLATYEEPTLAQASTAPMRWLLLAAVIVVGFLSWSILTLVYYALRDRR